MPIRLPEACALAASWFRRWMPFSSSEWMIAQAPAFWIRAAFSWIAS